MPHRERLPVDPPRRQLAGARAAVQRQKRDTFGATSARRGISPVSFEVLSPSPVELEPLLDEVYRVEAANWKGNAVPRPTTRRGARIPAMPPPPPGRASSGWASCGSAGGPRRCSSRSSVVRGSGC